MNANQTMTQPAARAEPCITAERDAVRALTLLLESAKAATEHLGPLDPPADKELSHTIERLRDLIQVELHFGRLAPPLPPRHGPHPRTT